MLPAPDAVEKFIKHLSLPNGSLHKQKIWFFGDKGAGKKNFVENFSAILREHYIKMSGCNERITRYGGMSQELRERYEFAGFKFEYCEDVTAVTLCSTHKTRERRQDIIESKFQLFKMGV